MSRYIDLHATAAERAEARRLAAEDSLANGYAIMNLTVSCYVGTGEDGRPEQVHERRTDGTCRCGYNKPYRNRGERLGLTPTV